MMRVVIIDDEKYAQENLKMKLSSYKNIQLVGMFLDAKSFLENVNQLDVDVIFLDVEMPEMNGLDILERLSTLPKQPAIIFVTAFKDYAIEAFEANALDYIVKPVTQERLEKALTRVKTTNKQVSETNTNELTNTEEKPSIANIDIRCLGSFSIKINGKEFNTHWRTKKTEEMLAYLIYKRDEYVSKESLAELLWPDATRSRSMSNFHVAFHYLQQYQKEFRYSLPIESKRSTIKFVSDQVKLDIHRFDSLIAIIEEKLKEAKLDYMHDFNHTEIKELIDLMEELVLLYRGTLFEGKYYEWTTSYASYYEMKYEDILRHLIEYYEIRPSHMKLQYYQNMLSYLTGETF